jgi:hypothetical protein
VAGRFVNSNRSAAGEVGNSVPSRVQAEAWARRSCAAQGIGVKVIDRLVIGQVVALLGNAARSSAPQGGRARMPLRSEPPHCLDTVRIEPLGPSGARSNGGVIDQGTDDGNLAAERKVEPLGAQRVAPVQADQCLGVGGTRQLALPGVDAVIDPAPSSEPFRGTDLL